MGDLLPLRPLSVVLIFAAGCGGATAPDGATPGPRPRPFRMGLTTFPVGPEPEAALRTWDFVKTNADLIVLHYDDGRLPWEALEAGSVPDAFAEPFRAAAERARGRVVFVAITPLNLQRTGVAEDSAGGPFPASLGPASFSNPRLRAAFQTYARFIVETLRPRYLALVIEANLYQLADPADFAHLLSLYKETYRELKPLDPSSRIFATFQLEFMQTQSQLGLLRDFEPELDQVGLSTYPSGLGLRPVEIPPNYLSSVRAFSGRGLVVSETGYGSEPYVGPRFSAPGSEAFARDYLEWLLARGQELSMEFVVWFLPADIPWVAESPFREQVPPELDSFRFFINMGLSRRDFSDKALTPVWRDNLSRPLQAGG